MREEIRVIEKSLVQGSPLNSGNKVITLTVQLRTSLPKDIIEENVERSQHKLPIIEGIYCCQWDL